MTNVVLEDVEERIFSTTNEMEVEKYDVYLFRGDDMYVLDITLICSTMVALYNEEKDQELDWSKVRADTIDPIQHSCVCYKQALSQLLYFSFRRAMSFPIVLYKSTVPATSVCISSSKSTSLLVRPFSYCLSKST